MKNSFRKTIPFPMFNISIEVVYCDEPEQWLDRCKDIQNALGEKCDGLVKIVEEVTKETPPPRGACLAKDGTIVILLQKRFLEDSTVAHESMHAAQFLEESANIRDTHGEFQAYICGYVYSRINSFLISEGLTIRNKL